MSTLRRYKMAATVATTGNALDTFTAQRRGKLKQVFFYVTFDSLLDNVSVRMQVSRNAVSDIASGGGSVTGSLAEFYQYSNTLTSGFSQEIGCWVVECDDEILINESLYLNAVVAGSVGAVTQIVLVIAE